MFPLIEGGIDKTSYFGQVSKRQIIVPTFETHGIETIGEQMKKASFALEAVSRK